VKHFASPEFWARLEKLPADVQQLARENYELLKSNPYHPSLHSRESTGSGRFESVGRIEHWESMPRATSCGSGSVRTRNTIGWWVEHGLRAVA
jgi:hypothetical protein